MHFFLGNIHISIKTEKSNYYYIQNSQRRLLSMVEKLKIGYKIIGTIKSVKRHCNAGHKVGDQIELSGYNTGGLCGFFYHDIFPYIIMLQFGGSFPDKWTTNPDVVELECMDRFNVVKIELKRIRK